MNQRAIELGMASLHQVTIPAHWATLDEPVAQASAMMPDFIRDILQPMNRQCGDQLPVSAFVGMEDGTFPSGTATLGETRDRAGSAGLAAGGLHAV